MSKIDFMSLKTIDFCDDVRDGTHDSPKHLDSGKLLITSKNIKGDSIDFENASYISEEDYNKINERSLVEINDVLYSMIGTVGLVYRVDQQPNYAIKNMGLFKIHDELKSKWLYYYLNSPKAKGKVLSMLSGTTQKFISLSNLRNLEIEFPQNIDDAKRIIKICESIDKKIKLNNEINNNLLEQCRCLYKEWFIDFNFISKGVKYKDNNGKMIESEKGLIPVGWIYKRIDELDLDISDGNYSSKYPTKQEFQTEGIPFIRGTDFNGYSISRKNLMYITPEKHEILKKGHLKKNDILITTRGEIGRIVFVSDYFIDSNINAQLIRINGDKRYPRSFLGMSLISDYVQNDIKSLVTGTALQQLPVGKFNQVKIIVPADEEIIKSFDSIVEVALKKIQENEEQNEILEQLRDTLLPKLINGEINLDNI